MSWGRDGCRRIPRGRFADDVGLRADFRKRETVSVWQADRELSGTSGVGRFQRGSATARSHR
jgi:hypothetical protein